MNWSPGQLQIEAVDGADLSLFPAALQRAAFHASQARQAAGLVDTQGAQRQDAAAIDHGGVAAYWREHMQIRMADPRFAANVKAGKVRQDAEGIHFARDLEYIFAEVVKELTPDLNMLSLFAPDSSVPFGARTHTQRIEREIGDAAIWRGAGNAIPRSDVQRDEESFPVRYLVAACDIDVFEQASSDFAGTSLLSSRLMSARKAIEQRHNRLVRDGSAVNGLRGVLTYPYVPKVVSSVAYTGATTPADIISDLNFWSSYAANNTKNMMAPNRVATSPRIANFLMKTPRSSTTDKTIGRYWLDNEPKIKNIEQAWEFQDPNGDGLDAIVFYNDAKDSIKHVGGAMQVLPVQRSGFVDTYYMFKPIGGVVMIRAGNNLIVFVQPPSAS